MEVSLKLFVYGTLRLDGEANYLIRNATLVESNIKLFGFKMYDLGSYPMAIASSQDSFIKGDVFQVDEPLLDIIDEYEGDEYDRITEPTNNYILYVGKNTPSAPEIPNGDWQAPNNFTKC